MRTSVAAFNGAAAFQPRKVKELTRNSAGRGQGFNGAAAFQPRKAWITHDKPTPPSGASMGPRLFSRGKTT